MSTQEIRMDPENPGGAPQPESSAGPAPKSTDPNLADELREFGKQIESMFNTARTSPRGKEIEQQLTSAWRDVEKGVNTAITKAQSSDISGTVQGTAQYATDEVQGGLARGLHSLYQWMGQKRNAAEESRKKHEQAKSDAATHGTADDEVADRFGNDAPVFGQDLHVPAAPVHVTPAPDTTNVDNPVADRFGDNQVSFGGSGEVK
jgi:hypothetical protein